MSLIKLKDKITVQTVVILVGCGILLAELIILAVFLVGYFFGSHESIQKQPVAATDEHREIVVPQVSSVQMNPFDEDDFGYDGAYLACLTQEYELGVDVSYYQGEIDWQQVRDAGFTFAIIRVGGRGYGKEGNLFADTYAQQNYEGAKAAGLKVGAYFFSQAITVEEAREEAWYALELISGWELDLPLVYDWEYISDDVRTGGMEESNKIEFTLAFFQVIELAGVQPMAYVAPWASEDYMRAVQDHPVWVVDYSDQMTFDYRFDYWQYSCTGSVPGITGEVDINIHIPHSDET